METRIRFLKITGVLAFALMSGVFLGVLAAEAEDTGNKPEARTESPVSEVLPPQPSAEDKYKDVLINVPLPDTCSGYDCPQGTKCILAESYPPRPICVCSGPECPISSDGNTAVSFDLVTRTEIRSNSQASGSPETPADISKTSGNMGADVSLWRKKGTSEKIGAENTGIIEANGVFAGYSEKMFVKGSRLFMETSSGEKEVNVLLEEAIAAADISDRKAVKKIELKEEAGNPVYELSEEKSVNFLFLIPVKMEFTTKINAQSGSVVSVEKPWWSFLVW